LLKFNSLNLKNRLKFGEKTLKNRLTNEKSDSSGDIISQAAQSGTKRHTPLGPSLHQSFSDWIVKEPRFALSAQNDA